VNLKRPHFDFLNHTADLGIRVRSENPKALFEDAVKSMMQIMLGGRSAVKPKTSRLSAHGSDQAELLVVWLGEILYLFHGEKRITTDVRIDSISQQSLKATIESVPFDTKCHEILCEIKAVTFHQIEVARKDLYWEAIIIFDV